MSTVTCSSSMISRILDRPNRLENKRGTGGAIIKGLDTFFDRYIDSQDLYIALLLHS